MSAKTYARLELEHIDQELGIIANKLRRIEPQLANEGAFCLSEAIERVTSARELVVEAKLDVPAPIAA